MVGDLIIVFINTPAVACEKPCDSLHRKLSMRADSGR